MTAKETVKRILREKGEITSHYCIDNRITTRLAAVVEKLRAEGMNIKSEGYIEGTKNFRYTYQKPPAPRVEYVEIDGIMHARPLQPSKHL